LRQTAAALVTAMQLNAAYDASKTTTSTYRSEAFSDPGFLQMARRRW
jgi:hypothetical protein